MNNDCIACKKNGITPLKNNSGFIGGIVLAILPKCPFCFLAFTSTVVLCKQDAVVEMQSTHFSVISIVITAAFCILIIVSMLLNLRSVRSFFALAFATVGIWMIMFCLVRSGGYELYYVGYAFIVLALMLSGSLFPMYKKIKNSISMFRRSVVINPYS